MSHRRPPTRAGHALGAAVAATLIATLPAPPLVAANDIAPDAGMLRYPDAGPDRIVFAYGNDLWTVAREGGTAMPLASPPGQELFPRFSPDGETIAFIGNYDGGRDLYTVPVAGGVPVRVTHHPTSEMLCDWTPDGDLLFSARGIEGMPRAPQLFTVDAGGGLPRRLPLPYGATGAISPDGRWLAYTPFARDTRTWKRYRGGMASDLWLFDLSTQAARRITDWEGTDTLPMWNGRTLYFLSDAGPRSRLNIWRYDVDGNFREQITTFAEYDVKWPSIGPGPRGGGEIVFQNGSSLYLLDLPTGRARPVDVGIPGARPTIRAQRVDVSDFTDWWHVSPRGKRAVVEARGDVWTLPAEHGSPRNLTRTSGAAERHPSWSPDRRWVAYFSDATGEYELCVTQSDGKGETRQLTTGSRTFYQDPVWAPDSTKIAYSDKAGRLLLTEVEGGATRVLDEDPWAQIRRPSWSHDGRWLAYARTSETSPIGTIWLHEIETDARHQVTSGMFGDRSPTFDRTGYYLYFASRRSFAPTYSDIDTSFAYNRSEVLIAVPLRNDVESPWLEKSDEETWDDEEDDEEKAGEGEEEDGDEAAPDGDDAPDDEEPDADESPAADDGISGVWEGTLTGAELPPGLAFTMTLALDADGTLTGSVTVPMGTGEIDGTYDAASGEIAGDITTDEGDVYPFTGTIRGGQITMTVSFDGAAVEVAGTRTSAAGPDAGDEETGTSRKPRAVVEIDLEGFETRAFMLPVPRGNFGDLAVNDAGALLYARLVPDGLPEIMLFDLDDEKREEKSVAKGAGGFELSADGKKLILIRDSGASIQKASAGATGKNVVMSGMTALIDPRSEWRQLLTEAWRLQRDYFYVDNMHGVDWEEMRARYSRMLDDAVTREDVSHVIGEMISELNIGHAYYGGGDVEEEPTTTVGMLGVDWTLAEGAYRIARIHGGAAWDLDARNPMRAAGLDVNEGDYVLAVNGVPVDPARDPWAAFVGTASRAVTLTVSASPVIDDEARDVVVKPIPGEGALRYRAWIEHNRAYVAERTDGQVGYIYVPNTGVNGQSDLVRQYFGQIHRKALIIDERWNGGGQIPTRFIEMLNRPVTNYWAVRDGKDWTWPPDGHRGPKCMLINGLAGSGGDMFPWLFREAGLGKLIGTRTWGGLVGISGNPGLIDGGRVTVPTFGFYERNGTWGIEGHGVDPDIEVIDDPALMCDGGDPQLDVAIDLMLDEIARRPYVAPRRPTPPNRSGMGIAEEDK